MNSTLSAPRIVSRADWVAARRQHLAREKELTRQLDRLYVERRELPWTPVEKRYVFDTTSGKRDLAELFGGRSQLLVYHFMFGPEWEQGCKHCSFFSDHVEGPLQHLEHHDVSFAAVSRAPIAKIQEFQRRMGWKFTWASSFHNDFNYDFHVSFRPEEREPGKAYYNWDFIPVELPLDELPGISVFVRNEAGEVFHTYSAYARGLDAVLGANHLLDLTPKGRDEREGPMDWVRHHDRYETSA